MNTVDIVLICMLVFLIARAFVVIANDRKKGKSCLGCSGDCSSCSLHSAIKDIRS